MPPSCCTFGVPFDVPLLGLYRTEWYNARQKRGHSVAQFSYEVPDLKLFELVVGGSVRESNPPTPLITRHNGFEVRKSHRAPSTPGLVLATDRTSIVGCLV